MKKVVTIILVFCISNCFAQSINDYQYLVIPSLFGFQKTNNQFGTQSLVEAYFREKGFAVIKESEGLPTELNNNKCRAMYVSMTEKSSMFSTKIIVFVKDCNGKILAESKVGTSNEKQYDLVYKQAVRTALITFPDFNYSYQAKSLTEIQPAPEKIVPYKELTEFKRKPSVDAEKKYEISPIENSNYQVERLANGFLIIDKTTNMVFAKFFRTTNPDIFIVKQGDVSGIATSKNEKIFVEVIENNILKTQVLNIKL